MVGFSASNQPASAATWGAAIDVPLNESYLFPGMVLTMLTPGAETSPPTLEKLAFALLMSTASTISTGFASELVQCASVHPKACTLRVSTGVNVNPAGHARPPLGVTFGDAVLVVL